MWFRGCRCGRGICWLTRRSKLTGRIGDTPTLGAGFWAEEWEEKIHADTESLFGQASTSLLVLSDTLKGALADCLPSLTTHIPSAYSLLPTTPSAHYNSLPTVRPPDRLYRSTAISGTGNGDSFLRLSAVRTASAIARYRPNTSLQTAMTGITGPEGALQESAGHRWGKTGEGEGGMIGIELSLVTGPEGRKHRGGHDGDGGREKDGQKEEEIKIAVSHIVHDYNCGGMFRAAVDRTGKGVCRVWRPGQYDLGEYEGMEGVGFEMFVEKGDAVALVGLPA